MRILLLIGAFAFLSFPLEAQGNLEYLRYQFQYFGDPPLLAVSINTREEMARLYARWKQNPEKTAAFCLYGELEQFELGDSTLVIPKLDLVIEEKSIDKCRGGGILGAGIFISERVFTKEVRDQLTCSALKSYPYLRAFAFVWGAGYSAFSHGKFSSRKEYLVRK